VPGQVETAEIERMRIFDHIRFMRRAAEELWSMAHQAPEIADELREMSDDLHAEAWHNRKEAISQPEPRRAASQIARRSKQLLLPLTTADC